MLWQYLSVLTLVLLASFDNINCRVLYTFHKQTSNKSNNTTSYNDVTKWDIQHSMKTTERPLMADDPLTVLDSDFGVNDMDEITLLRTMHRQLTMLRSNMANLKYQNHMIYKQMKRYNNRCTHPSTGGMHLRTAPQPQADAMFACPRDFTWNPKTNKCYKFANDRITWRMAREKCRNLGADLVSVESNKEQRFIIETAHNSKDLRHCDFWGGATDLNKDNQWRWVATKQSLSFRFWNHNEPNNGNGEEHCMQMLWVFGWMWNDARCNYESSCYICEMRRH